MAALTQLEFRDRLIASGIGADEPLNAVLLTIFEVAQDARQAVKDGARGLSKEGEAELVDRVVYAASDGASREIGKLAGRVGWRNTINVAAAGIVLLSGGLAAGWWIGSAQHVDAVHGASFLAQVASENDLSMLQRFCQSHEFAQERGTACQLPSV